MEPERPETNLSHSRAVVEKHNRDFAQQKEEEKKKAEKKVCLCVCVCVVCELACVYVYCLGMCTVCTCGI